VPENTQRPNGALSLAFSPCPNDTFIFHALVTGRLASVPPLAPPVLDDVETLNRWALEARMDVTKLSFHALGHVLDKYVLLDAGAALGRGCGPLLVCREPRPVGEMRAIAVPGAHTTAAMLMRLCYPEAPPFTVMRFDRIMPAVASGEIDAGVIIHESRFTYQRHGLVLARDLGAWWEDETGCPIPLGGIAARRTLASGLAHAVDEALGRSVRHALARPGDSRAYVKRHAQELDDAVIDEHIKLYVNDFSVSLGEEGRRAVRLFLEMGAERGIFSCNPGDVFLYS